MRMYKNPWKQLWWKISHDWNPVVWVPATILCIRFPFLYPRNRFTGKHYTNWKLQSLQKRAFENGHKIAELFYIVLEKFVGLFHIIPTYTELDALDEGWRKAFGMYICKDIKGALLDEGGRKALRRYRIDQIKEKFGSLCWYDHGGNEEVNKIITKYEYISEHTCIVCGKSADYITKGWIEPYCKEHLPGHIDPNDEDQVSKFYTKENTWYGHYRII